MAGERHGLWRQEVAADKAAGGAKAKVAPAARRTARRRATRPVPGSDRRLGPHGQRAEDMMAAQVAAPPELVRLGQRDPPGPQARAHGPSISALDGAPGRVRRERRCYRPRAAWLRSPLTNFAVRPRPRPSGQRSAHRGRDRSPLLVGTVRDIRSRHRLIRYLVAADLKKRGADTILGNVWWILDPLLDDARLRHPHLDHPASTQPAYPLFVFCAVLPWKWFSPASPTR